MKEFANHVSRVKTGTGDEETASSKIWIAGYILKDVKLECFKNREKLKVLT